MIRHPLESDELIDEIMENRKTARKLAVEAASRGDSLPGMLLALEELASPYFLGIDEDPDDSDLEVFP